MILSLASDSPDPKPGRPMQTHRLLSRQAGPRGAWKARPTPQGPAPHEGPEAPRGSALPPRGHWKRGPADSMQDLTTWELREEQRHLERIWKTIQDKSPAEGQRKGTRERISQSFSRALFSLRADATHSRQLGRISSEEKQSSCHSGLDSLSREAAESGIRATSAASVLGAGRPSTSCAV